MALPPRSEPDTHFARHLNELEPSRPHLSQSTTTNVVSPFPPSMQRVPRSGIRRRSCSRPPQASASAGLLLRTLRNFAKTDLGMKTEGLLVFGITPQKSADTAQNLLFYRNLLDRLRSLPGVESATALENQIGRAHV